MASSISREDAQHIAANLTRRGKPVPQDLQDAIGVPATPPAESPAPASPDLQEPSTTPADGSTEPGSETPEQGPKTPAILGDPQARPRPSGARSRPARSASRGRSTRSKYRSAGRSLLSSPLSLGGGNGGGLLLGIMIYPIILAIIKTGPRGPGLWIRAKFLNQGNGSAPTAASAPAGGASFTLTAPPTSAAAPPVLAGRGGPSVPRAI